MMHKFFEYASYALLAYIVIRAFKTGTMRGFFRSCAAMFKGRRNILRLCCLLAMTMILIFLFDAKIDEHFCRIGFLGGFFRITNKFGDGRYLYPALSGLFLVSLLLNDRRPSRLISLSAVSSLFSGAAAQIVKFITHRAKPYITGEPLDFFRFDLSSAAGRLWKIDYKSYPSGHSIIIFAAVFPLILSVKSKVLRVTLFLIALSASLARVYLRKHWFSDIFAAGILAYWFSKVLFEINKECIFED